MDSTTEMGEDAEADGMGPSGEALEGVIFDYPLFYLSTAIPSDLATKRHTYPKVPS